MQSASSMVTQCPPVAIVKRAMKSIYNKQSYICCSRVNQTASSSSLQSANIQQLWLTKTMLLNSLSFCIHAQAFCSSITGALATMAILKGVGVGDSSATPLAATITWMLKGQSDMFYVLTTIMMLDRTFQVSPAPLLQFLIVQFLIFCKSVVETGNTGVQKMGCHFQFAIVCSIYDI